MPDIELVIGIVWARDPKTKREAKTKCVEVQCTKKSATQMKKLLIKMCESEEYDTGFGDFIPYTMAPEIKVQAIIEQQKFNAKVQRVEVDGIHSEVMYAHLSSTGETTLIKWLCQVKVNKDNNDERRNLF